MALLTPLTMATTAIGDVDRDGHGDSHRDGHSNSDAHGTGNRNGDAAVDDEAMGNVEFLRAHVLPKDCW